MTTEGQEGWQPPPAGCPGCTCRLPTTPGRIGTVHEDHRVDDLLLVVDRHHGPFHLALANVW